MAPILLNTGRIVGKLRDAGFSDAQAYALVRLLADVRSVGFDAAIAHQDLVGAGFTETQATALIDEAVLALQPRQDGP